MRCPRWGGDSGRPCRFILAVSLLAALLSGCAGYRPEPLLRDQLLQALETRSPNVVELQAGGDVGYDPSDGLSLPEAEVLGLCLNPALQTARLRASIPVLGAAEAGRWDDPEFGADVMRILRPEPAQAPWIVGGTLSFSVPISGRLAVEKSKASAEGRAALSEVYTQEQQFVADLRNRWVDWVAASRAASASREQLARLQAILAVVENRATAGELTQTEAGVFRIAAAMLRSEAKGEEGAEAAARLQLVGLLGLPPAAPVEFVPGGALPRPDQLSPEDAATSSPLVLQRAAEYDVAEQSLRLEVRKQYPDLQLGPAYGREDGQDQVGFGASIPLPFLNANRRAIVEARAARDAARSAWEEAVQAAIANLGASDTSLRQAEARREVVATELLPLVERQMAGARRLAELGEIDALLLLESIQSQRESVTQLIQAEADMERAKVALMSIVPQVHTRTTRSSKK